ncbi:MAG: ABC transporter ATP-binding protein [Cyanobacteria bacterium P01_F01_bin.3]
MLDIQNLSVSYRGTLALDSVSLKLGAGEWVGLIGPNGAGKSTLIKAVLGLLSYQGQVLWKGQPVSRQRRKIAYVPQRSQIDWDYPVTPWSVVKMALVRRLGWGKLSSSKLDWIVMDALERMDLVALRARSINELSGGQQQRVFLARAIAQQADLFLLDEPFSGIDRQTESMMVSFFEELKANDKTILICSHEWGSALKRYDRLLLLNRRLLANDTPKEVMTLDNIQQAYGAGFSAL